MPVPDWWAPELRRAGGGQPAGCGGEPVSPLLAEGKQHALRISGCCFSTQTCTVPQLSRSTQDMSGLVLSGRNLLNSRKMVSVKRGAYKYFL